MLAPEASLHSALPLLLALLTCSPGPSSPLAPTPAGRAWKPKGEAKSLGEEALPILFTEDACTADHSAPSINAMFS